MPLAIGHSATDEGSIDAAAASRKGFGTFEPILAIAEREDFDAIFCLGMAGLWIAADPRWVCVRLMIHVEVIMVGLILLALLRAWSELSLDKPATWVVGGGSVGLLLGSAALCWAHRGHPAASPPGSTIGDGVHPTAST